MSADDLPQASLLAGTLVPVHQQEQAGNGERRLLSRERETDGPQRPEAGEDPGPRAVVPGVGQPAVPAVEQDGAQAEERGKDLRPADDVDDRLDVDRMRREQQAGRQGRKRRRQIARQPVDQQAYDSMERDIHRVKDPGVVAHGGPIQRQRQAGKRAVQRVGPPGCREDLAPAAQVVEQTPVPDRREIVTHKVEADRLRVHGAGDAEDQEGSQSAEPVRALLGQRRGRPAASRSSWGGPPGATPRALRRLAGG